jgi:gamma-glutamyltranspeptidase/glutathione hydrolase
MATQGTRASAGTSPLVTVMARQCTGRGASGVVCAAAPLAAQAGAAALRAGGNAYDAVVAMGLAESVLLPPKCGLGGDLVAIAHGPTGRDERDGRDLAPQALLAVGGAPAALGDVAASGAWRDVGPVSVGPPGAPAGYLALAARGVLPLARLAAPAIELARTGFPWADVCADLSRQSVSLLREMNPDGCVYLPGGEVIDAGAIVRLPRLADAIESFVSLRARFLEGPVGAAILREVRERGGVLDRGDLARESAEWQPCAQTRADGRTVWATPAPTHGPALLAAVAVARPDDTAAVTYRRVVDAIEQRFERCFDPSGTSMVSAVDSLGNAVVVVHSNSYPRFGSGIVVRDYELVLANRAGRGFTPQEGHPNFPRPGQRPVTTLHAWAVAGDDGGPRFLGGTPGGDNQVPWNVQTITQILAGERDPGILVTSPRWDLNARDGSVRVEDGLASTEVDELTRVATRVSRIERWALRSAQQVVVVPRSGEAAVGAADPRTVGAALGV